MADISSIVGITLMIIGGIFVVTGMVLCYTTKGEYYNQDEVQAMVAAEVLEDEKKKKAEADAAEQAIKEEMMEGAQTAAISGKNRKRRGPMIAS